MIKKINPRLLEELKMLEKEGGLLTATAVLARAESQNSVLHDFFEWDNTEAAYQYRLQQARMLIVQVQVEIARKATRAFYNVSVESSDGGKSRGYVSVDKLLSNQDLVRQRKQQILERIEYWTTVAEEFDELRGLIEKKKLYKAKESLERKETYDRTSNIQAKRYRR